MELEETGQVPQGANIFICSFENCSACFTSKKLLDAHLYKHTGKKPFLCDVPGCGKGFTRKSHLQRHQFSHTGERPFRCSHEGCLNTFTQKASMKKHIQRIHENVQMVYKCNYENCTRAFKKHTQLKVHLCEHTNELPYQCKYEECGKRFRLSHQVKRHEKTHKGYDLAATENFVNRGQIVERARDWSQRSWSLTCLLPPLPFVSHTRTVRHWAPRGACESPPLCARNSCNHSCLHRCTTLWTTCLWLSTTHGPHGLGHGPSAGTGHEGPRSCWRTLVTGHRCHTGYKCQKESCDYVAKTWTELRKHVFVQHPGTNETCSRVFSKNYRLKVHAQTHDRIRQVLTCPRPDCQRTYMTMWGLRVHLLTFHENERPHPCTYPGCGKTFCLKCGLDRHVMAVHTAQRANAKVKRARKRSLASHLSGYKRRGGKGSPSHGLPRSAVYISPPVDRDIKGPS
uniref:transcription factor IIIA-like n=1 Tax=Myxine glutinosa TaxID=7769 RepID=UPI00358FDF17